VGGREELYFTRDRSLPLPPRGRFNPYRGDKMSQLFRAFVTDDEGQGLVEYALLLALIAIVSIIAITNLGTKVKTVFETIDGKMKV
jgi:pilus assembly protein Flp/PilA